MLSPENRSAFEVALTNLLSGAVKLSQASLKADRDGDISLEAAMLIHQCIVGFQSIIDPLVSGLHVDFADSDYKSVLDSELPDINFITADVPNN